MKIKKILSLLLCVALCIVPLPFQMSAAEFGEMEMNHLDSLYPCDCEDPEYIIFDIDAPVGFSVVGTVNYCGDTVRDFVRSRCTQCGTIMTDNQLAFPEYSHNYVTHRENGSMWTACSRCGYRVN